ncbi:MAG: bacterial regulatory protein, arsR family [Firmicutes bacterium]|nr:bacterial regulatory protein, arsR family [Bacillota bacterium]
MMDTVKLAKILKALSHPKRLELFFKIAEKRETEFKTGCECECFVTDMIHSLKLGAPTISHHIKELENAGLITTERKGKYLSAKVREETVAEVNKLFADQMRQK